MAKYGSFKYGTKKYGLDRWIYDRSQTDLDADNDRVYINYWDLNRLGELVQELVNPLVRRYSTDYAEIRDIAVKTTWEAVTADNYATNTPNCSGGVSDDKCVENIITAVNRLWENGYSMQYTEYAYHSPNIPQSFQQMDIYGMNNLELALLYMHIRKESLMSHLYVTFTPYKDSDGYIRYRNADYNGTHFYGEPINTAGWVFWQEAYLAAADRTEIRVCVGSVAGLPNYMVCICGDGTLPNGFTEYDGVNVKFASMTDEPTEFTVTLSVLQL